MKKQTKDESLIVQSDGTQNQFSEYNSSRFLQFIRQPNHSDNSEEASDYLPNNEVTPETENATSLKKKRKRV